MMERGGTVRKTAGLDQQVGDRASMMIGLLLDIVIVFVVIIDAVIVIVVEKLTGSVVRRARQRRDFHIVELA
jgi:hypothetical protein